MQMKNRMLVFLDTEFTALSQPWPKLISIGLIHEDGKSTFYAEMNSDSYMNKVEHWVKTNVLPLLEGGSFTMTEAMLRKNLLEWVKGLGEIQIATDTGIDFEFLQAILKPWPKNVDKKPHYIAGADFADAVNKAYSENPSLRRHHALDDAKIFQLAAQNLRSTQLEVSADTKYVPKKAAILKKHFFDVSTDEELAQLINSCTFPYPPLTGDELMEIARFHEAARKKEKKE
jgi:hypothetical protein